MEPLKGPQRNPSFPQNINFTTFPTIYIVNNPKYFLPGPASLGDKHSLCKILTSSDTSSMQLYGRIFFAWKKVHSWNRLCLCPTQISLKYVFEWMLFKQHWKLSLKKLPLFEMIGRSINWPYDKLMSYTLLSSTATNSATWWRYMAQNPITSNGCYQWLTTMSQAKWRNMQRYVRP